MISDATAVLDRQQLRDATFDDDDLMHEILCALIDDTSRQIPLLEAAIREKNSRVTRRLAHYSKGACANVGARSAVAALEDIERTAGQSDFDECGASLRKLAEAVDQLRVEALQAEPRT